MDWPEFGGIAAFAILSAYVALRGSRGDIPVNLAAAGGLALLAWGILKILAITFG